VILAGLSILLLPQRKIIVPFLLTTLLIPYDQILVIAGLHFPILRILIFFAMIRIFLIRGRGKWSVFSGGANKVDKCLIFLFVTTAVAGVLLFLNTQELIFQLGEIYTGFGTYFLLRCVIRDRKDVVQVIRTLAVVTVVLGGVMLVEHWTKGWNPYALLGGAKAQAFASGAMRDGSVRATGSFAQPILAGTFGAVAFPLFFALWLSDRKQRAAALLGMLGATLMVLACNSNTAVVGYSAGIVALCFWPIRSMLGIVRWGIAAALVGLQIVMKAPVYHLITRVGASGDSYHRYMLIDQCVHHFFSWWLIGTKSTASWGWDMWDTADQYVQTADNSGLLALILLVAILVFGFRYLSKARRSAANKREAVFIWAIGAALFAQAIAFFGISLWQQAVVEWYLLLAVIAAVGAQQRLNAAVPQVLTELRPATESPTFAPANQLARQGTSGIRA